VTPTSLHVRPSVRACAYAPGAAIGAGEVRTYLVDPVARQLLRRDEATGLTVPVIDNVMAMTVEYPEGARRVRITLRFAPALARPLVPDLEIAYDVMPPTLQGPW
jgi:hypothetical protein